MGPPPDPDTDTDTDAKRTHEKPATGEVGLWAAVIEQALRDLRHKHEIIRADAERFFAGRRLVWVLGMAGCGPDIAEAIREHARRLAAEQ